MKPDAAIRRDTLMDLIEIIKDPKDDDTLDNALVSFNKIVSLMGDLEKKRAVSLMIEAIQATIISSPPDVSEQIRMKIIEMSSNRNKK